LNESYEAVADAVYRNRVQVPIGRRARRNKLAKLRAYDLIRSSDDPTPVHEVIDASLESELELGLEDSLTTNTP
jgi:hypothetical protein